MKATLITEVTGTAADGEWNDPHGIRSSVVIEPRPGVIQKMTLGHGGLLAQRGEHHVGIPLPVLLALLEKHCPDFRTPEASGFRPEDIAPEILEGK